MRRPRRSQSLLPSSGQADSVERHSQETDAGYVVPRFGVARAAGSAPHGDADPALRVSDFDPAGEHFDVQHEPPLWGGNGLGSRRLVESGGQIPVVLNPLFQLSAQIRHRFREEP